MKNCEWLIDGQENCGKITEGKNALCASHGRAARKLRDDAEKQLEKKSLLLQKQQEKNKKPKNKPNPVSEKRKELNKEYFKLVEQFKIDNPHCKANVNEYCTKNTDDPHHRKGRGKFLLDVSSWLPVCRSCHQFIEQHPKESKQKGWSESRLATTEPHKI